MWFFCRIEDAGCAVGPFDSAFGGYPSWQRAAAAGFHDARWAEDADVVEVGCGGADEVDAPHPGAHGGVDGAGERVGFAAAPAARKSHTDQSSAGGSWASRAVNNQSSGDPAPVSVSSMCHCAPVLSIHNTASKTRRVGIGTWRCPSPSSRSSRSNRQIRLLERTQSSSRFNSF